MTVLSHTLLSRNICIYINYPNSYIIYIEDIAYVLTYYQHLLRKSVKISRIRCFAEYNNDFLSENYSFDSRQVRAHVMMSR
jgi:hypothetical protein